AARWCWRASGGGCCSLRARAFPPALAPRARSSGVRWCLGVPDCAWAITRSLRSRGATTGSDAAEERLDLLARDSDRADVVAELERAERARFDPAAHRRRVNTELLRELVDRLDFECCCRHGIRIGTSRTAIKSRRCAPAARQSRQSAMRSGGTRRD